MAAWPMRYARVRRGAGRSPVTATGSMSAHCMAARFAFSRQPQRWPCCARATNQSGILQPALDGAARLQHCSAMRANYRMQRLFMPDDLAQGAEIEANPQQSHYLTHVLRLAEGAELLLFNGRDGEWSAAIASKTKKAVRLRVLELQRPQPGKPDLVYCFAPLKQGRLDYLVQKAVEM